MNGNVQLTRAKKGWRHVDFTVTLCEPKLHLILQSWTKLVETH